MQKTEGLVLRLTPGLQYFLGPSLDSTYYHVPSTEDLKKAGRPPETLFEVHPVPKQKALDVSMVSGILLADSTEVFMQVPDKFTGIILALSVVDKFAHIDTSKRHKMLGVKERLDLGGMIEYVFWGSEIVRPEVLKPY